jgi:hypothetical protein
MDERIVAAAGAPSDRRDGVITPALTRPAQGRGLLRRHAGDLVVVAATVAFVALAGLLGLWLLHSR